MALSRVMNRMLLGIALCTVCSAYYANSAEALAPPENAQTVRVNLNPLGMADSDGIIGGTDQRACILPINTALLRRVVLSADDLHDVVLQLSCKRQGWHLQTLASQKETNGTKVDFSKIKELQNMQLSAGDTLTFVVWKTDWHWHGGGNLKGLRIIRTDGGGEKQESTLVGLSPDGGMKTPLGEFGLIGISKRERLPEVDKIVSTAGSIPGAENRASVSVNDIGVVKFHTNGRADWSGSFDWAPALTFCAETSGTYSLEGILEIVSARPDKSISWIVGKLKQPGPSLEGTRLSVHQMLKPAAKNEPLGKDAYRQQPLAEMVISASGDDAVKLELPLTDMARSWLTGEAADYGLLLKAENPGGAVPEVVVLKSAPGVASVLEHPRHVLFDHKIKPRSGVYATMKNGRLYYGDERLRLWGVVAGGSGERNRSLGFNCLRAWGQDSFYNDASAKQGIPMDYVKGDGCKLDLFDKRIADVIQNEMFIMLATTCGVGMPLKPVLEDGSWLHELYGTDKNWGEWKKSLQGQPDQRGAWNVSGLAAQLSFVDPWLWEVRLRHARNVLDHRNPYTGKRYAEEEAIAVIEINNEAALAKNWIERGFSDWPAYFRNSFQRQWNAWLRERYKDDDGLKAAWGKLNKGENLVDGSVELEPVLSSRLRYPELRLADFVAFIYQTLAEKNRQYVQECRSLAPKGVGANAVPFSYDSQYRPSIPWAYTNYMGDSSTVSMYFWNTPSMLNGPPGMYVLDSHRIADRLAVIYETQRGRPSPYRAEFPYMISVMTCWQDFDIVVFHGAWIGDTPAEQLLAATVQPPESSHFWTAVHMENDPVISAATAAAGRIFLSGMIESAPNPVTYKLGKKAIFSYDNFNGIGSREMSLNTFSRGTRLKFAPEDDSGLVVEGDDGQGVSADAGSLATGKHALWDWNNGRLIIDAPNAKVYVGKTVPSYTFKDGITISGFNTPFISFSLISADDKPLSGEDACQRAYVSAVFDCKNTGFEYDYNTPGGPLDQAKAVKNRGHAPIIVDKVSYTLSFPFAFDAAFTGYDFAMRQTGKTPLTATNTLRQKEQTIWMGVLDFSSRGGEMPVAVDPSTGVAATGEPEYAKAVESTDASLDGLYNPIPNLSWGDNYERTHRILRDSLFIKASITGNDYSDSAEKSITLKEAEIFSKTPADVDLLFSNDRMKRIVVTFCQAPAFGQLIADMQKQFGAPVSTKLSEGAYAQSEVKWIIKSDSASASVLATEVQGVVRITYVVEE